MADHDTGAPLVHAVNVTKSFHGTEVLKGIDMDVRAGEVVVLLGPSGSGKTTFLRCINQLETIDGGRIWVDGDLMGYEDKGGRLHRLADKRIADLWRSRYRHEARVDALRRNMIGLDVPSASDEVIAGLAPAWLHELSDDALDLLRRVVDGATVTEIAEQLGITPNAVSSRLTRLRAKIPVLLEKEAAGDRD